MITITFLKPRILLIAFFIISLFQVNCKKFVEVSPPNNGINAANVYMDDAIAASVLTGIYTNLSKGNSGSFAFGGDFTSLSLFAALSADELNLYDLNLQTYSSYFTNSLGAITSGIATANFWNTIYPYIFIANSAIEGLNNSTSLTPIAKAQLIGEAKFVRAFCYFYLINLYGDVPLALSSDWKINATLARTPIIDIYQQIVADLKDAQDLMNTKYLNSDALTPATDRVRPNRWVATALLARVYLYLGNYLQAETEASKLIQNSTFELTPLNSVFLKTSTEAIWQLQAVGTGTNSNTGEGKILVLPSSGPSSTFPIYLSTYVVNSFEAGDQRKNNWVGSITPTSPNTNTYYYPNKYKIGATNTSAQEYCTIFRLAEQYLIRSEARAMQGNLQGAIDDINILRLKHGGLTMPLPLPTNQANAVNTILHERQVELFTEWGHRWLDLKRTKTVNGVMPQITTKKGGVWESTDELYPIPQLEISYSPQLIQNAGY